MCAAVALDSISREEEYPSCGTDCAYRRVSLLEEMELYHLLFDVHDNVVMFVVSFSTTTLSKGRATRRTDAKQTYVTGTDVTDVTTGTAQAAWLRRGCCLPWIIGVVRRRGIEGGGGWDL